MVGCWSNMAALTYVFIIILPITSRYKHPQSPPISSLAAAGAIDIFIKLLLYPSAELKYISDK